MCDKCAGKMVRLAEGYDEDVTEALGGGRAGSATYVEGMADGLRAAARILARDHRMSRF